MPQTSMTAWLKPKAVTEASQSPGEHIKGSSKQKSAAQMHTNDHAYSSDISHESDAQAQQQSQGLKAKGEQQIPAKASLEQVSGTLLPEFRRLIQLLLPIPYGDKFYKDILSDAVTASITLAVLWRDQPSSAPQLVAGIRGRLLERSLQQSDDDGDEPCLYIAAIGTLAPFRRYGLASALLARVIATAIEKHGVRTVTAHVWEANQDAREWYGKLGFEEVAFDQAYYRRLRPSGAYMLKRRVTPTDLLRQTQLSFQLN